MKRMCLRLQRGLSLLEVSLALAIGAVFVVWQLQQRSEELKEQHLSNESGWLAGVSSDLLQELGNAGSYTNVSTLTFGQLRSVPSAYLNKSPDSTVVTNGFGGDVELTSVGLSSAGDAYVLSYSGVPRMSCAKFLLFLEQSHTARGVSLYAIFGAATSGKSLNNLANAFALDGRGAVVRTSAAVTDLAGGSVTLSPLKASPDKGLDLSKVAPFCADNTQPYRLVLMMRRK